MVELWLVPLLLTGAVGQPSPSRPAHAARTVALTALDAPAKRSSIDTTWASHPPLLSRRDLWLGGAFVVGTAALMPLDRAITEEFRDPGPQRITTFRDAANDFNVVGSVGVIALDAGLYGIGRLSHSRRWAELGLYGAEAIVVASGVGALIKGFTGRARPYVNDNDADSYTFGRGFRHTQDTSFPSGHVTATSALATVIAEESAHWGPHAWYVKPAAYGGTALVALARIYTNKHWASDVILGTGVGVLSGLAVVHYNAAHPHNWVERVLLSSALVPTGHGGMMLVHTVSTR